MAKHMAMARDLDGSCLSEPAKICLLVHKKPTQDDTEALGIFEELKALVQAPHSLNASPKFKVVYIENATSDFPDILPRLVDGAMWVGIDEIRNYFRINRKHALRPSIE